MGLGTISLLGDRMVIESVTGDSRVTPVVSGEDSGEEEGDEESVLEVSLEGLGDDELEESDKDEEEEEEEEDDDEEDDGSLPVAGAPSRAAAPSGPVVEK